LRRAGHYAALQDHAIPLEPALECQADTYLFDSGLATAGQLLRLAQRPTAIFASNDYLALAVFRVAAQLGLRVPADLSVVGFDDVPAAAMAQPGLTTVRQPLDAIGRQAIDILVSGQTAHYRHIGLGFDLVQRESLASPSLGSL